MRIVFSLSLPPDVESVPVVRSLVRSALVELKVEHACVRDVALAVTEACANVISHAGGTGHEYEVQVELDEASVHIRVIDTGDGFDPEKVEGGPVGDDAFAESGRGILLMRAMMDELEFLPAEEHGTIVHLRKALELEDDSPLSRLAAT
jgi:serine/threonine-protein kinase RsbW